MPEFVRQSFSLEPKLLDKLEKLVAQSGYTNRSEFIRDMIRQQLVDRQWQAGRREVVGTITLVYDHHARQLSDRLTDIQHDHHHAVLATTHVHLDHDVCAEMIMMRGRPNVIRRVADQLRQQKGVLHTALSLSSTGDTLK
jgi:CopG family nickel-responsive transcriptional regulator